MSEQLVVNLETRTEVGSNVTRKYRKQGLTPGILYGHSEPLPVLTDAHAFRKIVPVAQYGSQVVRLKLDGKDAGSALVKVVQLNTVTRQIMNIDFLRVSVEDRVNVSVSVVAEGESPDARAGAVLEQFLHSVNIRCSAFEVPSQFIVDISSLHIGDVVHAAQLPLPPGCELVDKPEELILLIAAPTKATIEEPVEVEPGVIGPELTGEKQKDDFPPER